jgi:hypothetical protein
MDIRTIESLGVEDSGKWLPFIFHMSMIDAAKVSSDDLESSSYNCTTIFTNGGESYIIDTPPEEFFKKFTIFNTDISIDFTPDDLGDDEDLDL